jgi:hypothetical protein
VVNGFAAGLFLFPIFDTRRAMPANRRIEYQESSIDITEKPEDLPIKQ